MSLIPLPLRFPAFLALISLLVATPARASDHADPVELPMPWDLFGDGKPKPEEVKRLTGGLTDLFVFPIDEKGKSLSFARPDEKRRVFTSEERAKLGKLSSAQRAELLKVPRKEREKRLSEFAATEAGPASKLTREELAKLEGVTAPERAELQRLSPDEISQIKGLAIILCARRALTNPAGLELSPYTYKVFLDHHTPVTYEAREGTPPADATKIYSERARYGGRIGDPKLINSDVTLTFRLKDNATLQSFDVTGLSADAKSKITVFPTETQSGVRDDPFIFPVFFKSNVVAMAVKIPLECFPSDKRAWIAWAGSYRDGRKIDHDGRSLRTQQPRFGLFNPLEPKDQVEALAKEKSNPSLMRNFLLRFGVPALFNYRDWDSVPDVMIYNSAYDVRFPNGRLLTDDVAAELAENGDTLLYELSYAGNTWPRATENDKSFSPDFPYLAEPWPADAYQPATPPSLSERNKMIVLGAVAILVGLILFLLLGWIISVWRCRKRWRERYL